MSNIDTIIEALGGELVGKSKTGAFVRLSEVFSNFIAKESVVNAMAAGGFQFARSMKIPGKNTLRIVAISETGEKLQAQIKTTRYDIGVQFSVAH